MDKRTICLIVLNVFLIFLLIATKRKKRIRNIVLLLSTVVVTLSATEFLYRLFFKTNKYYVGDLQKGYLRPDSLLGYTIKAPGSFSAVRMNRKDTIFARTYNVIADSSHPRMDFNHRTGYQNPGNKKEIVFIGCSVTFGVGLNDTACIAYKTGRLTQHNTLNLGVEGYGTHQVYQLFISKYAGVSNANRVYVYSFINDHILRANGIYDWNAGGPFFSIDDDSLIRSGSLLIDTKKHHKKYIHYVSGLSTFSFLKKMLGNMDTRRRIAKLEQEDFDRCFLMIKAMADMIQSTGGQFVILDWGNKRWNSSSIHEGLLSAFKKKLEGISGVHIVKVSSIMDLNDHRHFIPDDGHPTEWANEKLAVALSSMKFW